MTPFWVSTPIWLITGCISLSDSIQSANSRLLEERLVIIVRSSEVFALFVPPFEVTILNHSPRLILAVPSKVSVQKMGKLFCRFSSFDPTWYITDVNNWGRS
jgi:hypothetical protein